MSDPFLDDVEAEEIEAGPFRTADATRDARLARAREGSYARVADATSAILEDERQSERRLDVLFAVLLGVSLLVCASVFALQALTEGHWLPWLCPGFAAVISFAIVVFKRRGARA